MFCAICGNKLERGVNFCVSCGTQIPDGSKRGIVRSRKSGAKQSSLPNRKFRFGGAWVRSTIVLLIASTILFGLFGAYEDGFMEPFIGLILLSAILGILGALVLKWRESGFKFEGVSGPDEEELSEYRGQRGLGGWLTLVGLGLFITAGFSVYSVYADIALFMDGTVEFLSNPSSALYIPGYSGMLKLELIADLGFLLAAIYLIYLFFQKNKKFPKYYIPFLFAVAAYVIIDYFLVASISVVGEAKLIIDEILEEQGRETGKAVLSAIIWSLYIAKSKQVKATFVN